jgi:hypothetical protein
VGRSLIDEGGRYPQIVDIENIARVLRPILGIRHSRSKCFPDRIRGGFLRKLKDRIRIVDRLPADLVHYQADLPRTHSHLPGNRLGLHLHSPR